MTLLTNHKIGSILVSQNIITDAQRKQILEIQQTQAKPFGLLAERLFDVDPQDIEKAWLIQYEQATLKVDLAQTQVDSRYTGLISKRQAWQFGVLPMNFQDGCLMIATTKKNLARAHRFATKSIDLPFILVLTDQAALENALTTHYQGKAMKFDHLLAAVSNRQAQAEIHTTIHATQKSHQHQLVG